LNSSPRGFTLLEIIIVISIMGVLAAISTPTFLDWAREARYRDAARGVASALREARSRAISTNQECDVEFDIDTRHYWLSQGGTTVFDYGTFPAEVKMATGEDCDNISGDGTSASDNAIQFNPNGTSGSSGTADSHYVCVLDNSGSRKFKSGVTSTTTGRIAISKRNAADTAWD